MKKINNIVFLGRKKMANEAIKYLFSMGYSVKYIIIDKPDYFYGIDQDLDDKKLYELISNNNVILKNIDLVISYLFWKKIKNPLIKLPRYGCINFHPAPLPDYKGRAGYNTAILDNKKYFGVSAHYINNEEFDIGPIIKVNRFKINANESAHSLEARSQKELFELFKEVLGLLEKNLILKTYNNTGGIYVNKKELEQMKEINLRKDSLIKINKKINAFFFPPYQGANINIKGKKFSLINEELLHYFSKIINE